jgi:carboxylesterase type B
MLPLALGIFVVTSVFAGFAQSRFHRALLSSGSNVVTPDAQVATAFRNDLPHMPRANARETTRRLKALMSRQADPAAERWRWATLLMTVLSAAAFVWIGLTSAQPV